MRKLNKQIDSVGRIIVDSLMLMLLFGILALPASTITLLRIAEPQHTNVQVLSVQDERENAYEDTYIPKVVEIPETSMPGMLDVPDSN